MPSASSTACLIAATVESMLTMTPFFNPRETCVPMPMTSSPLSTISATMAAILVVPMSSPTMMSELRLAMLARLRSFGLSSLGRLGCRFLGRGVSVAATQEHRDLSATKVEVHDPQGRQPAQVFFFHSF